MHAIAHELDAALGRLDAPAAAELERAVRDALLAVGERGSSAGNDPWAGVEKDAMGYPVGYFEKTFGCLAGEPFDYPDDPPPEPAAEW